MVIIILGFLWYTRVTFYGTNNFGIPVVLKGKYRPTSAFSAPSWIIYFVLTNHMPMHNRQSRTSWRGSSFTLYKNKPVLKLIVKLFYRKKSRFFEIMKNALQKAEIKLAHFEFLIKIERTYRFTNQWLLLV